MKDVRLNLTQDEKVAQELLGTDKEYTMLSMNEDNDIHNIIRKEQTNKFNNQVDEYVEKLDKHQELLTKYAESFSEGIGEMEIMPLYRRILVKPFPVNPFQRMKMENGIITDLGGLTPEHFSQETGEMEEDQQVIFVGTVIEAGPECKYIRQGDVIFYNKNCALPVPFFKQGLWCFGEDQVIAVVNSGLTERFNKNKV